MIKRLAIAAALFGAACTTPVVAQEPPASEEQAAIAVVLQRGEALYRYDQAAWHGTDAMLKDIKDPRSVGVSGWIINEVEKGHEVVFYGSNADGYYALWSGVYTGKKVRSKATYDAGERALTSTEALQAEARSLPSGEDMERCSAEPFNTVVLPTGKSDGSLFVYYLVPQAELGVVPFGGHYRYEVKGGKIIDRRNFTNSCISLGNRWAKGETPVATAITHSLDPIPTEIHVFSMYALKIPVAVIMTQTDKTWMIQSTEDGPVMGTIALGNE